MQPFKLIAGVLVIQAVITCAAMIFLFVPILGTVSYLIAVSDAIISVAFAFYFWNKK